MATIYPATLPPHVLNDPKRAAEVAVYESLRDSLSSRYTVFYSFTWLNRGPHGRARDGEADFLVVHPDKGILLLEVKGGGIAYDGTARDWTSRDRTGSIHAIHNPIDQLRNSKYALIDKLRSTPAWRNRWVEIGHAVVFPDCLSSRTALAPDMPREIVLCLDDFPRLGDRIASVYDYWASAQQARPIGDDGVAVLVQLLAPTFELPVPLAAALRDEDRQIVRLTEEQFNVLEMLRWNNRVSISGGAGTGKTLLAVEKAVRLAREGYRTLFVCFNRLLAEFVAGVVKAEGGIFACTFHQLCCDYARRAHIELTNPDVPNLPQRFFEQDLPLALIDAAAACPEDRFDAIIVDEGQDFRSAWWPSLELLLTEAGRGTLYVFHDDNQRLYAGRGGLPAGLIPIGLTRNLRNTRPIFVIARGFYRGSGFESSGPAGRPAELLECSGAASMHRALARRLSQLLRDEAVPASDIAVLSGRPCSSSSLKQNQRVGNLTLTGVPSDRSCDIFFDSIYRFKGLERPVVILVELDEIEHFDELVYVGVTRARLHLIAMGNGETLRRFHEIIHRSSPAPGGQACTSCAQSKGADG